MAYTLNNGDYQVTVYGLFAPQYIRTDRNGTKIYHDINCPRCAGYGESDNWWQTGRTCFKCGGSGKRANPKVVKVYTQEYADKLLARDRAKAQAEAQAAPAGPSEEELKRAADETRRNRWEMNGFSRDGVGYLYTGKTYKAREQIREAGGEWHPWLTGWIAPVEISGLKGVQVERVTVEDLCGADGNADMDKCHAWQK